jgi:hypothetical protein
MNRHPQYNTNTSYNIFGNNCAALLDAFFPHQFDCTNQLGMNIPTYCRWTKGKNTSDELNHVTRVIGDAWDSKVGNGCDLLKWLEKHIEDRHLRVVVGVVQKYILAQHLLLFFYFEDDPSVVCSFGVFIKNAAALVPGVPVERMVRYASPDKVAMRYFDKSSFRSLATFILSRPQRIHIIEVLRKLTPREKSQGSEKTPGDVPSDTSEGEKSQESEKTPGDVPSDTSEGEKSQGSEKTPGDVPSDTPESESSSSTEVSYKECCNLYEFDDCRDLNTDQVNKKYKQLALKHHPDKGGSTQKFVQVHDCMELLTPRKKTAKQTNKETHKEAHTKSHKASHKKTASHNKTAAHKKTTSYKKTQKTPHNKTASHKAPHKMSHKTPKDDHPACSRLTSIICKKTRHCEWVKKPGQSRARCHKK